MKRALEVVAVLVAVVAGACGSAAEQGSAGDRVSVVASFYPLFEAVERVGGEQVSVVNLTAAGSEPHDLELTTTDVDRIEDADLVLYFGSGFQPAIAAAAERSRARSVDLLEGVDLLDPGQGGGDSDARVDPHVWLDPIRFKQLVGEVAGVLAELDPDHADAYRDNAAAYGAELDDLDARFAAGLAECQRRTMVTSHAAFAYLAARYDLVQEPIAGLEPELEPDPRRLAELADDVSASGTTTIFFETLVSPRVAEALAREAGVETAQLDPLEGLSADSLRAGRDYLAVMDDNLDTLRQALGCS